MAHGEPGCAPGLGAPAGTLFLAATTCVHAKTTNGHEDVFARLHKNGDEAARTRKAVAGETSRRKRSAEETSLDQAMGDRSGAVIGAVIDTGMTTSAAVWVALDAIGGINDILDLSWGAGS